MYHWVTLKLSDNKLIILVFYKLLIYILINQAILKYEVIFQIQILLEL